MSQSAPLPGSVFRFRPEVDEVLNPAKEKALTSIELIRGLRPQPSGRPGAQVALPQSLILRDGTPNIQILNLVTTML